MVEWVVTDAGLQVLDDGCNLVFEALDWRSDSGGHTLPCPAEARITGSASAIRVPASAALSTAAGRQVRYHGFGPTDLSAGEYRLTLPGPNVETPQEVLPSEDPIARDGGTTRETYIGFSGPTRVRREEGSLTVSFPERTPITIGFGRDRSALETVTVPRTPAGIATAISQLSAALRTTSPDRSHPALRGHPPLIAMGDEFDVPASVGAAVPDTGITLHVPDTVESLFVAAPLAYYLGADVVAEDRNTPVLSAPAVDLEHRFRSMPSFQHDATALLRRVFLLDCLVRTVDPGEVTPAGGSPLDRVGLDPERIAGMTPAERLRDYRSVPAARIEPELPDWHLSTYVEPTIEHARSLPYLLDDLSLIYLPSASELDGEGLLRRSLDDFYRAGEVVSVDRLEPELHAGHLHGWLAPGTPIDVFKATPSAYEHRHRYDDPETPLDVTVVFNDSEMEGEHARVAEIYRERAADLPVDVTVEERLTREELAAVFAAPHDFVHYIGHCDVDGLCCPDGSFSTASLEECRTRTFFLNACGSYHEGLGLVDAGSVAGAVTLTAVLNKHAAIVGTAFARLLVYGFDIEQAIRLSRRRIMMGKDYAIVGDGTHTLAPRTDEPPTVARLEERDDRFELIYETVTTGTTGNTYRLPYGSDDRAYLRGVDATLDLDREEVLALLERTTLPVVYDGDFHWSTEIVDRLER